MAKDTELKFHFPFTPGQIISSRLNLKKKPLAISALDTHIVLQKARTSALLQHFRQLYSRASDAVVFNLSDLLPPPPNQLCCPP